MKAFLRSVRLCLLCVVSPVRAEVPEITVGKATYRAATVQRLDDVTARITHADGIATVTAWELTPEQQTAFGFSTAIVARRKAAIEAAVVARENQRREQAAAEKEKDEQKQRQQYIAAVKNDAEKFQQKMAGFQGRQDQLAYMAWRQEMFPAGGRHGLGHQSEITPEQRAILKRILPGRTVRELDQIYMPPGWDTLR